MGKTTLARELAKALCAHLDSPTGQEFGALRQRFLEQPHTPAESQAFYAGLCLVRARLVRERLEAGQDVVLDRYWASVCAYAHAGGDALDLSSIEARLEPAAVTLWLDVDERERQARIRRRLIEAPPALRGAAEEDEKTLRPAFAARLREGFALALARPFSGRVLHLGGVQHHQPTRALSLLAPLP